jgi:helvolic acid biosynthesis cytochrome P450 monooxygenase
MLASVGPTSQLHQLLASVGVPRLAVVGLLLFFLGHAGYRLYFSPLRHIPGSTLSRLFTAHSVLKRVFAEGTSAVQKDYDRYGDVYVNKPNGITISNPKDIKTVLTSYEFRKTDIYGMLDIKGRASIFTNRDPGQASQRRRQLGPFFNHNFLGRMEPLILKHSIIAIQNKWDRLIEQAGGGPVTVNFRNESQYTALDTIGALAFGREFHALANDDPTIIKWIESTGVYLGTTKNFPLVKWYPFSKLVSHHKTIFDKFVHYSEESVEQRREYLDDPKTTEKPVDLLQGFIDAEDPESSKVRMTPQEVSTESIAMQLAGSETTSFVTSMVMHLFTLYPEHHRRAMEEVRSQFPLDHLIGFDECRKQLPFLEAFIYETLRYCPLTSGFFPRINPTNGITIQGHYIPPGTEVAINLIGAHTNPEVWDKPHFFDPTRFLDDDTAKRNVFTFSYGHRNCIGRNLAWMEMMVVLANILKDYDISLPEDSVCGPHNVDELGRPRIMPTRSILFTTPKYPERDCRIVVTKRTV